jgi:hypothetical protein
MPPPVEAFRGPATGYVGPIPVRRARRPQAPSRRPPRSPRGAATYSSADRQAAILPGTASTPRRLPLQVGGHRHAPRSAPPSSRTHLGKPITEAIDDAVVLDRRRRRQPGELTTHQTLPGFSCANFESIGPPPDWRTFMRRACPPPRAPSRTDPVQVTRPTRKPPVRDARSSATEGQAAGVASTCSSARTPRSRSRNFDSFWELGETAELTVSFAPTGAGAVPTAVRIQSDDPDEQLDVGLTAIGRSGSPRGARRAPRLKDVDRETRSSPRPT